MVADRYSSFPGSAAKTIVGSFDKIKHVAQSVMLLIAFMPNLTRRFIYRNDGMYSRSKL
jgi:hypothetical protein